MNFYGALIAQIYKMRYENHHIGLFSLRLFLLPGEQTTLHIFEPRYLQLISECIEQETHFGIPFQGKKALTEYGSLVKIIQILKTYDNGELDIMIECVQNFKLNHYEGKAQDKLYPAGTIIPLRSIEHDLSPELMHCVSDYLKLLHGENINDVLNDALRIKNIVNMLNLKDDEKLRFIKITEETKQNDFLISKTRFMTILLEQERKVEDSFYLN